MFGKVLLNIRNTSFFSTFALILTSKTKQSVYLWRQLFYLPEFSLSCVRPFYNFSLFLSSCCPHLYILITFSWVSFRYGPPPRKYDAQNILQQHMSKEYSLQCTRQLPHSNPVLLLKAALNHTGLFGSHITLVTHSGPRPTIIPKDFFNLYFCYDMTFSVCILTIFILSKCKITFVFIKFYLL